MRVLVISDIVFEPLGRNQLLNTKDSYTFVFSEDLVTALDQFQKYNDFDLFYIHFDSCFKKYRKEYIGLILVSIFKFSCRTSKEIIVSNIFEIAWSEISLIQTVGAAHYFLTVFQSELNLLQQKENVRFFDVENILNYIGRKQAYNYNLGHLYQLPYTKKFIDEFSFHLNEYISKIYLPDKKVIVLDCDNTLWKGILGEDGINGIACNLTADGIIYFHFQQFILSRKLVGFVLCLCSKNNEDDVKNAFAHLKMPLKWDDFLIHKVNWENKDNNIREIAINLNIGLESFIFIDDNDFELNVVRQSYPEVTLFKMKDSYDNLVSLTQSLHFQKKVITSEDISKTDQYLAEELRKNHELSAGSIDNYLASLDIKINVDEDLATDFIRVSQLTEKTNQFNFNKKVYTPEILKDMVSNGLIKCFTLRVSDKFGDYGLVGVIIIELADAGIALDNFILSCRILGRKVEYTFFNHVRNRLIQLYKADISELRFVKTEKNIPAQEFYNDLKKQYDI